MSADSPIALGSILESRYEILSLLGEGGFGVVYRAKQISTGQLVAIKVLHPEQLAHRRDADAQIARFQREMEVIGQLQHPNIVRLYDSGTLDNGQLYTVLEYIDGEELSDLVDRDGALSSEEATRLLSQVMEALATAHAIGIVHRDLKPQNIMVSGKSRRNAMVLDFGIASVVSDARGKDYVTLTKTGEVHGTPAYMAPEQLEANASPQSDIYAWGLIFVEALTGTPVVQADSVPSAIFAQLSPEPIKIPPIEDEGLRGLLEHATEKDPKKRYSSAEEVLTDLEAIASGRSPVTAPSPRHPMMLETADVALADTVDEVAALAGTQAMPSRPASSTTGATAGGGRSWRLWAIVALLALGVGGGVWMWRNATPDAEPTTSCPEGQNISEDTQGQCCWPGQAWNGQQCVGLPTECPSGYSPDESLQSCVLPPCGDEKQRQGVHCCWAGQAWSESKERCLGIPECPEEFIPDGENCLNASGDAWLNYTGCEAGNMRPCVELALMLQDGIDAERSETRALSLLQKACDAGNLTGCYHLGVALRVGLGTEPDTEKAGALLADACEKGQHEACFDLAALEESSPEGSPERVVELLDRSCSYGHKMGCDALGMRYHFAIGVPAAPDKALALYQKACRDNYLYACTHYAWMLRDGLGVEKDDALAMKLFSRSCEAGETLACVFLARWVAQSPASGTAELGGSARETACRDHWYEMCDAAPAESP